MEANFSTTGYISDVIRCLDIESDNTSVASFVNASLLKGLSSNDSLNLLLCANSQINESDGDPLQFIPRFWVQLLWAALFGTMVTVAVVGNAIVIWIVVAHKNMRTVTNFFLLNLTIADLMMATFNAIFNFVYMLHSDWPFGQLYCIVNNFIASLTVASSVFTITATSIDRYIAVVHPMRARMSRRTAAVIIAFIWLSASLLASPNLAFSEAITYVYPHGQLRTVCFLVWPDGQSVGGRSEVDYLYNILLLVLTYVIPMISMAIAYSIMARELWWSQGIGEESEGQREAVRSKQKVARMLIAVVVIFGSCWLPYHAYFLFTYHFPEVVNSQYIQHVYLAIYWLAMSHSMHNPIIYCWMNKRFRNYFGQALGCITSRGDIPIQSAAHTAERNNHHLHEPMATQRHPTAARLISGSLKNSNQSMLLNTML